MNRWWFKAPIILGSVLMVATTVFFGTVVYAATGDPEYGMTLTAGGEAFAVYLAWLLEMVTVAW